MNAFDKHKALILGAAILATGAGAIGVGAAIAQESDDPVARDGALHRADWRGGHGDRGGRGGHRGGAELMGLLEEADADGDGAVTQAELDEYRAARVGAVDASGDGALDVDEFDTLYRELTRTRMGDAFQRLDEDGDGAITTEEMDARFGGLVERFDRDGDGALSEADRGRGRRS